MNDICLSTYGSRSRKPSPVNRMMAEYAGDFRDGVDINLGVGYVNEATIPRDLLLEAKARVLENPRHYRAAYNYGSAEGSTRLRASIRQFLIDNSIGQLTPEILDSRTIIVGANGATSLLEAVAQVQEPGIVVTSDPVYYIYSDFLERMGFRILAVPEEEDGIDVSRLKNMVDALGDDVCDIRFLYLVTINNPSSTILSDAKRSAVVSYAGEMSRRLGRKIPVVFDRAYEDLIHDPAVPALRSGLHVDELGIVFEVGTLSKVLAPGLRIGYMIGKDGDFLRAIVQRTSDIGFSAAMINQEVASYMLDNHVADQLRSVRAGYRAKAVAVSRAIRECLGDVCCECRGGQAGFYYYLTFRDVEADENSPFFRYVSRRTGDVTIDGAPCDRNPRVIYVPGTICVHACGELVEVGRRQLRLSYGFESVDAICKGLNIMREAAEYAVQSTR